MSIFRFEVVFPRSMIIGFMPLSKSLRAAKSPAGPEPIMITDFFSLAVFHSGVKVCVSDSGISSFTKTLSFKTILICLWRASIYFFLTIYFILLAAAFMFFSASCREIFCKIIELLFSSSGCIVIENSVII